MSLWRGANGQGFWEGQGEKNPGEDEVRRGSSGGFGKGPHGHVSGGGSGGDQLSGAVGGRRGGRAGVPMETLKYHCPSVRITLP